MSQTKVKSCMYASKLLTERSPVAKCVMIAEADMDAAELFCAVPDGTGHRDMARSKSSARALGRPADGKTTEVHGLVLWRDGALWTVSPCNCENADLTEKKNDYNLKPIIKAKKGRKP